MERVCLGVGRGLIILDVHGWSIGRVNQIWHYPGPVDTVSTGLKIHGVQANRPMGERFRLRSGGDEWIVLKLSGLGSTWVAKTG